MLASGFYANKINKKDSRNKSVALIASSECVRNLPKMFV